MKIASKKPNTVQQVVYVTNEIYEIWYAKPASLGKIHKRGGYWYTTDGHRHVSSRDAMHYLISHTTTEVVTDIVEGKIPDVVPTGRKGGRIDQAINQSKDQIGYNQNHPQFQQFLDFIDYQNRTRIRQLERAGGTVDTVSEKR